MTENKGDLISREALRRIIKTECNPYGKPTIDFESGKKVLNLIDNAPTVNPYFPLSEEVFNKITDAEFEHGDSFYIVTPSGKKIEFEKKRPKGEWKRITMNEYLCSNCRYNVNSIESLFYKFCPKCGSDMRSGNNG